MKIQGIDHVECYVGDLDQSAAVLRDGYGFRITGQRGRPGSGPGGGRSLLLRQGRISLLLTSAQAPGHPAADYVRRHGDGVAVIAFRTDGVRQAFEEAVAAGATPLASPVFTGQDGDLVGTAVVSGFGDVAHKLVEHSGPADDLAAGVIEVTRPAQGRAGELLEDLDHIAVCLPAGELDSTVMFYRDVFGLAQIFDERIEVGGQAMLSKVVQDPSGNATFTLIEPDLTREPGQIDEFLGAHGGAGVQHLAFRTSDIVSAVRAMSSRGVEFLSAPASYFALLEERLGQLAIPVALLQELNVLADTDRWGQMFQIFTQSTHERRTLFFELIERQGALTFGSRNIKALYEALEVNRAATKQLK